MSAVRKRTQSKVRNEELQEGKEGKVEVKGGRETEGKREEERTVVR